MPFAILKTPKAEEDLLNLASHIAQDNLDAALRFLDAAEAAFHLLAERPGLGSICHFRSRRAQNVLAWSIKGFQNYVIFYRPIEDGIEVIRVLHGARDMESLFD